MSDEDEFGLFLFDYVFLLMYQFLGVERLCFEDFWSSRCVVVFVGFYLGGDFVVSSEQGDGNFMGLCYGFEERIEYYIVGVVEYDDFGVLIWVQLDVFFMLLVLLGS